MGVDPAGRRLGARSRVDLPGARHGTYPFVPMTVRTTAIAVLLLTASLAGCGSSQPSSAAEDTSVTPQPTAVASSDASTSPGASAEPTTSSEPESPPVAQQEPPKPGNPTFKRVDRKPGNEPGVTTETYRITWTEPKGAADSFLVYGMTDCPRYSKKNHDTPCVVRGMPIDVSKLTQLSAVPGDKRSTTVSWDVGEIAVPPYSAILIRAANDAGNSIFTIVKSYDVCFKCVY